MQDGSKIKKPPFYLSLNKYLVTNTSQFSMKIRCFYTNRKSAFKAKDKKEVRFSEELDPGMIERQNFCSHTVSVARPRLLIARKLEKLSVEKHPPFRLIFCTVSSCCVRIQSRIRIRI
jgi:hypothetical protein